VLASQLENLLVGPLLGIDDTDFEGASLFDTVGSPDGILDGASMGKSVVGCKLVFSVGTLLGTSVPASVEISDSFDGIRVASEKFDNTSLSRTRAMSCELFPFPTVSSTDCIAFDLEISSCSLFWSAKLGFSTIAACVHRHNITTTEIKKSILVYS
jgi:hypothetical protein